MRLDDITILVTGSNRGIGRAIVEALAEHPVRVLAGMRETGEFEQLGQSAHSHSQVRPVRLDLSSAESIEDSLAGLGAERQQIDVLVNNAGEFTAGQFEHQDLAAIYAMVQSNLTGLMHLTHALLPPMLARGSGKIVNQASIAGYLFVPGISSYAATKAGVVGFTECLARELEGTGVGVLELVTGGVDTDMLAVARAELNRNYGEQTDSWVQYQPREWAAKVVRAIADDEDVVGPGGAAALAKLATRAPRWVLNAASSRAFSRTG
jgi:short-subunit dehydrogenase